MSFCFSIIENARVSLMNFTTSGSKVIVFLIEPLVNSFSPIFFVLFFQFSPFPRSESAAFRFKDHHTVIFVTERAVMRVFAAKNRYECAFESPPEQPLKFFPFVLHTHSLLT
jgi:hypothetical protein